MLKKTTLLMLLPTANTIFSLKFRNFLLFEYYRGFSLLLMCSLLFLSGCTRHFNIKTTTFSDPDVLPKGFKKGKSFYIESLSANKKNNLETKEQKEKISILLKNKGYVVTENKSKSDYYLAFNYSHEKETVYRDVLTYIPGPTCTTNGSSSYGGAYGTYDETTSFGSYVYLPKQITLFTKTLSFYIYNRRESQQIVNKDNALYSPIWHGTTVGIDESSELRNYFDYLIVSMINSLGNNNTSNNTIWENNESINLLRKKIVREIIKKVEKKNPRLLNILKRGSLLLFATASISLFAYNLQQYLAK